MAAAATVDRARGLRAAELVRSVARASAYAAAPRLQHRRLQQQTRCVPNPGGRRAHSADHGSAAVSALVEGNPVHWHHAVMEPPEHEQGSQFRFSPEQNNSVEAKSALLPVIFSVAAGPVFS